MAQMALVSSTLNNNNSNNAKSTEELNYMTPGTVASTTTTSSANAKMIESRCAELFANYCDMLLRKTALSRHLTSDQIEAKLKNVVC